MEKYLSHLNREVSSNRFKSDQMMLLHQVHNIRMSIKFDREKLIAQKTIWCRFWMSVQAIPCSSIKLESITLSFTIISFNLLLFYDNFGQFIQRSN